MPRIAPVLVLLLASACQAPTDPAPTSPSYALDAGHNAADHFTIDEPVSFQIESPCNGELIDFVGRDRGQLTKVDTREGLDAGFFVHFEHLSHVTATGTGPTTGTAYSLDDRFREIFQSPSPSAPQVTVAIRETMHVSGSTPGTSFTAESLFHLVVTPTGELKITRDIGSATCRA